MFTVEGPLNEKRPGGLEMGGGKSVISGYFVSC